MKLHFSWTINPNPEMELQSRLGIAAARDLGHCTIWVQDKDYQLVSPKLKRMAEVIPYRPMPNMELPWSSTPKWSVEPKGDVIIGLDADVMVWRPDLVLRAAEDCLRENAICGTIGYAEPFPLDEWRNLFKTYNIPENFPFRYTNTLRPAPFYINLGVVMIPSSLLKPFRESYYKYLPELNIRYPDLYFMCQVATTISIIKAGLAMKAMPRTFNYTEVDNPGLPLLQETIFLHYNISRKNPLDTTVMAIREKTRKLERENAMPINSQEEVLRALQEVMDFLTKQPAPEPVQILSAPDEFTQLKTLLESPQWPEAVPGFLICDDVEKDKTERANGIIELMVDSLGELQGKVLDFGCGEGHTTKAIAATGVSVIGYDPVKQWGDDQLLTTDWQQAQAQGPYEIVLLYDVLDHCQDPAAALRQLREVLTPTGKVYCRCHPWTGPHAGHHYKKINKAYVHLVFTEEELRLLGLEPQFKQPVRFPINETDKWFKDGGFRTTKHNTTNVLVDRFFKDTPLVSQRLLHPAYNGTFPEWQMSQAFNDFVLVRDDSPAQ